VYGVVVSVDGTEVLVHPQVAGLTETLRFSAKQLRKRFQPGNHVKVVSGRNAGEAGMIVAVSENVVTLLSEISSKEITVFSKDLRDSGDSSVLLNPNTAASQFELYELVTVDENVSAVVIKIEGDNLQIIDQNGTVRMARASQISRRKTNQNAAATDSRDSIFRVGDQVREVRGENRDGTVLHINRAFSFVRSKEQFENAGVFVAPNRNLLNVGVKAGSDSMTGDINSYMRANQMPMRGRGRGRGRGGTGFTAMNRRGPRDKLVSATVMITSGPYKTYIGIVKEVTDGKARVELHTNSRLISIEKRQLAVQNSSGNFLPYE
ncbi:hypothetical protein BJ085DRAFT_10414, partial [Dimargaris cristalligena]